MMDDKKIAKAARQISEKVVDAIGFDDSKPTHLAFLDGHVDGFNAGAKWAINEFLKDLWHPMQEEPKLVGEEIIIEEFLEGKRYTMVQNYMVGVEFLDTIETIRWISDWDSFLAEICDDVKMIRWCYFKDLLPKEGGEQ